MTACTYSRVSVKGMDSTNSAGSGNYSRIATPLRGWRRHCRKQRLFAPFTVPLIEQRA